MENNKSLVSIIVPVYNVQQWLNKCIDSLISQSYKNIEVLLINDGSTDRSGEICDEYSSKDSRIKVIHISNNGQSVARNKGLHISKGEYVLFIDSDDYLCDREIIKKFVNILNNSKCDFIYTSYCRFNDGNENEITEILPINLTNKDIENKLGKNILADLITQNSFHHAPYLKVCRRDFILKNNLYFREGYYHEDVEWSFKVFYYAKKIVIYNDSWYMRRMRENSTITSIDEKSICKRLCDRLTLAEELLDFFIRLDDGKNIEIIIDDIVNMYWGDIIAALKIKDKSNRNNITKTIKDTKRVLTYSKNKKHMIIVFLYKILGIKCTTNILKIIGRIVL